MSNTTSILSDLAAAAKRLFTKAGEAVVDANAVEIIEQRMRDAEDEVNSSREQLANIMAKRKVISDDIESKKSKMQEYGKHITTAKEKQNLDLAREVAQKYAELEAEVTTLQKTVDSYDKNISTIKERNKAAEEIIAQSKTRIDMLKANEAMIDASAAVSDAHSGADSSLTKALETAERLEKSQQERIAQIDAAAELEEERNGVSLEKKLKEAGIVSSQSSVDDILSKF